MLLSSQQYYIFLCACPMQMFLEDCISVFLGKHSDPSEDKSQLIPGWGSIRKWVVTSSRGQAVGFFPSWTVGQNLSGPQYDFVCSHTFCYTALRLTEKPILGYDLGNTDSNFIPYEAEVRCNGLQGHREEFWHLCGSEQVWKLKYVLTCDWHIGLVPVDRMQYDILVHV